MYRAVFRFPTGISTARRSAQLCLRGASPAAVTHHVTERSIATVVLPSLSPTMETGVISEWKKKPGDVVLVGDILCDIDTDKASVGFEVSASVIHD